MPYFMVFTAISISSADDLFESLERNNFMPSASVVASDVDVIFFIFVSFLIDDG